MSNTRTLAKAAALELIQNGQRPTAELVRQAIGQGSQQTILHALDEFWLEIGERLREPRLPEALVEPMTALWRNARETARGQWQLERATLGAEVSSLQQRLDTLSTALAALTAERDRLSAAQTVGEQRIAEQGVQVRSLEEACDTLKAALTRHRDETGTLRAAIQAEREGRERDQAAWLRQIDQARQALKDANAERMTLEQRLGNARDVLAQVRLTLAEREQRIVDLMAQIGRAEEEGRALQERAQQLTADVQAAERQRKRGESARQVLVDALQMARQEAGAVKAASETIALDRDRLSTETIRLREELAAARAAQRSLEDALRLALSRPVRRKQTR